MRKLSISIVLIFAAFLLAAAALMIVRGDARASGSAQTQTTATCLACHPRSFAGEVHGLGLTNPIFKVAWDQAGGPKECLACHVTGYDSELGKWKADIISCEACHSPIPENHPDQDMPVDKTNNLCAQCHNDSRFGWSDWKTSVHYKQEMTCSNCHDPHLPRRSVNENISIYCEKCHEDMAKRSEHSIHTLAGVSCISCHLGPKKGVDQNHQVPDHSFIPVVETCNACHAQQMHDPKPTPIIAPTITPTRVVPTPTLQPVITTPAAPGNAGSVIPFSTLDLSFMGAGLLGLGAIGGLALSPVLDWFNRLLTKKIK